MAKIKHRTFKTMHIPYLHEEDEMEDQTDIINQSTNMGKIKIL